MNIKLAGATALTAMLVLTGCTQAADDTDTDAAETPAAEAAETPEATEEAPAEDEPGTIVEVAAGNEDFSTLVTAVEAAGLVETLSGEGPFTVFAPTNEAFEQLPDGLLDALLMPENDEVLSSILEYHVVEGEVLSADIEAGEIVAISGEPLDVTTNGDVQINTATVVQADVEASNGVIHAIDEVLIPPDVSPEELLADATPSPTS